MSVKNSNFSEPVEGMEIEPLTLLRVRMAERNLKPRTLAQLTGFSSHRISNVLVGSDTSWPIRAAINQALEENIFSKPQ